MADVRFAGYTRGMLRLWPSLFLVALWGCQCNLTQEDLNRIPDGGNDDPDAGPPPPVFPLKVGDQLQYPVIGGTTKDCAGETSPGSCQRVITADFIIKNVTLNDDTNRWVVIADALYQGADELIEASAIAPLILENAANFGQVSVAVPQSAQNATFTTDAVMDDGMIPNHWPFFEYRVDDAGLFEQVGNAFCERFRTLDPDATCRVQHGDQKFETYYRDEQAGASAMLHKVREEFHQMGFVCGWDEALIPFTDGIVRDEASFSGGGEKDLAASFFPPRLIRDGVTYQCSCSTQLCRASDGTCLDINPDAPPAACP